MTIIKSPQSSTQDYDFIAFCFNNKNSLDDFGIYRVSDGSRYNVELTPTQEDITAEAPAMDGMYYFKTSHKQKVFNVNFAFDNLTESKLRELRSWLAYKNLADLWFPEEPYKIYSAKVTGQPSIKYLCFMKDNQRCYKGEGTVQFTAYWPYAHTPDYVDNNTKNGKVFGSYAGFATAPQWQNASGLTSTTGACVGENPGDLPAPFVLSYTGNLPANARIGYKEHGASTENIIEIKSATKNLQWDSKTGIVSAENPSGIRYVVETSGSTQWAIPPSITGNAVIYVWYITTPEEANVEYVQYWYLPTGVTKQTKLIGQPAGAATQDGSITTNTSLNYHYWYY